MSRPIDRPLRICLIASSRFPVREPFAGGLEAHTHSLARALVDRGHSVSLFAAPGSDRSLDLHELPVAKFTQSDSARSDVAAHPDLWAQEHHAYLSLMLDLAKTATDRFDIVHNNSLHYLPVAMADAVGVPLVTTLHTPPLSWLESAIRFAPTSAIFAAVSEHTARAWSETVSSTVVLNGIDTTRWIAGPGGGGAIWFGRLVPEKAPHLAIRAAKLAGVPLQLAGPSLDNGYFDEEIAPLLDDTITYIGHLSHTELTEAVGRASVAVVTPSWDEPYGLVAAEAMACGTPVAAFARGALPEIITETSGRLAEPDSVSSLATAILEARDLDRALVRRRAVEQFSLARMVDDYERLYYRSVADQSDAAPVPA
jgi:glycosyltransferase involved in cell wall biosynthesis